MPPKRVQGLQKHLQCWLATGGYILILFHAREMPGEPQRIHGASHLSSSFAFQRKISSISSTTRRYTEVPIPLLQHLSSQKFTYNGT